MNIILPKNKWTIVVEPTVETPEGEFVSPRVELNLSHFEKEDIDAVMTIIRKALEKAQYQE